ncbi:hypothetical protein CIB84_012885 [Bambusicola thoracicus]|uniref:CCDC81 HU domain-containing protein n=1 Tax=Bambusicola thoracicus TaxID=9083 RepID=A0A2P4SGW8_BAMTH|nr:hypothetical protein CIB84_012885 [Bambusicola thoracicus]
MALSCLTFQAVDIGIGSFAVVSARADAGEDGVLVVDKPIFQLNQDVQQFYKIKESKTKIPSEMFEHPLNFREIAETIAFRVPIVEQCIHETLLFFAEAVRGKKEVDFFFERLGVLSLRGQEVIMNFSDDCVLQLDATGNMLPALLGDSKMMNMIAFRGKNKFTRRSEDGCIVLPRIAVESSKTSPEMTCLKPRRESQPWCEGARRVKVYDPVMLAQRGAESILEQERRRHARARFLSQAEEEHVQKLKQQKPPIQPQPPSASATRPSRTAARLVHAQTEKKRRQVLIASKRKEFEAEIQSEYQQFTWRLSLERSQNPFHRLLEGDPRPSYVVRREYDKQLRERLKGKDRAERLSSWFLQEGEKMRLLDRGGKAQGLPTQLQQP